MPICLGENMICYNRKNKDIKPNISILKKCGIEFEAVNDRDEVVFEHDEEDAVKLFNYLRKNRYFVTKAELIDELEQRSSQLEQKVEEMISTNTSEVDIVYINMCKSIARMMIEMRDKLQVVEMFDAPDCDMWRYEITIDSYGIYVELVLCDKLFNADLSFERKERYVLVKVDAKFYDVDKYAEINDVKVVTVRQWIRRGRIHSCKKFGNEWRISELNKPYVRGRKTVNYRWNTLLDVPDDFEYAFINDYTDVSITQSDKKKSEFVVVFSNGDDRVQHILSTEDKERLELFLISNPMVNKEAEVIISINDKKSFDAFINNVN